MHEQDKQRLLALIVIAVIIFGALGYFLWNFVLNKGTIFFNGQPPFTITINSQVYECSLESCEMTIREGTHDYQLNKEGYNSLSGKIVVKRGQELTINADLSYTPTLAEPLAYTMFSLPAGYSKFTETLNDISLFKMYKADYPLKRLPKKLSNIVFSQSGEKALIFEEDQVSTYMVDGYTLTKIEGLTGALDGDFNFAETTFYTVAYDEHTNQDALIKVDFNGKTFENLVYFTRDIEDYEIKVSESEKYAIVADKTGETEVLYLIDFEEKSRTNVYEGSLVLLGEFDYEDSYFVFEAKNNDENLAGLKYLNVAQKTIGEFDFNGDLNLFDFAKGPNAFFITYSDYNEAGMTIEFVKGSAEILTVDELFAAEQTGVQPFYLFKWDPILNEYSHVMSLNDALEDIPLRLEASENGNIVRFLVGDNYYDLALGE